MSDHDEIIKGLATVQITVEHIKDHQTTMDTKIDDHFKTMNGRVRTLEKHKNWLWGAWAGFTVAVTAVWQAMKIGG